MIIIIRKFLFNLDERVKVWMTLTAGVSAIYSADWRIQAAILSICLVICLLCGAKRFVAVFVTILTLLGIYSIIAVELTGGEGDFTGGGMGIFYMALKFGPFLSMMVFIQAAMNASRFLHSLENIRVPSAVVIPFGVCLRFIPSVVEECRNIRYAMRIRGIRLTPKRLMLRPFETLSYVMVPLLVRSLAIGEELARAAIARGIENQCVKTSLYDIRVRAKDTLFLIFWTMGMIGLMTMDHLFYMEILREM